MWLEVVSRDTNGFLMTADQVFNYLDFNIDQVAVQSQPVGGRNSPPTPPSSTTQQKP